MTFSTSEVAVCSLREIVSRSSLSSRVFSMAMTAWAAKFCHQLDLLVGERAHFLAVDEIAPTSASSLSMRDARVERAPPKLAAIPGIGLRGLVVGVMRSLSLS